MSVTTGESGFGLDAGTARPDDDRWPLSVAGGTVGVSAAVLWAVLLWAGSYGWRVLHGG